MNHRLGFRVPAIVWLILLVLPGLVPLARGRFFESPDGVLHAYRVVALDHALRSGVLYPRWFPEFSFGYGFPMFNFFGAAGYYPALAATFLGADAALALKIVLAAGQLASALGMFAFARQHLRPAAALVAALAYAYLPYHLVDLYVRGAVGEFMAFAWLPWILWAIRRAVVEPATRGLVKAALAGLLLGALVMTHNLSALAFGPVLAGYVLLLWLERRDRRVLGCLGVALGSALVVTSFYWLPILAESRYVGLTLMRSQGYQAHMLSPARLFAADAAYRYAGDPAAPSVYPIGLVQALILVGALAALIAARRGRARDKIATDVVPLMAFFLAAALVSIFLLTTASLPLWRSLEVVMAYFQFPWRLQVVTVLATALLAGGVAEILLQSHYVSSLVPPAEGGLPSIAGPPLRDYATRGRLWKGGAARVMVAGLCLWLMAWALWRLPVRPISPALAVEDMWAWERQVGQVGTTWDAEFLPVWVTEQRWAISQPAAGAGAELAPVSPGAADAPRLEMTGAGYTRYEFTLDAPSGARLVLHQFHFPGWQARWLGESVPSRPAGSLGLATFDLPPGRGELTVRLGLTPVQLWGTWVSALGFLLAGVAMLAYAQTAARRSPYRAIGLALAWLVPGAMLVGHLARPDGYVRPVTAVNANLGDRAELLAYSAEPPAARPGETLQVTLYWQAAQDLSRDYKAFVHLTDAALTRQPAQHDGDPGGGYTPTSRWLRGEIVPDVHPLALPPDLAPGPYSLWAGLYEPDTVTNLPILSPGVRQAGDRVYLGDIEVVAP